MTTTMYNWYSYNRHMEKLDDVYHIYKKQSIKFLFDVDMKRKKKTLALGSGETLIFAIPGFGSLGVSVWVKENYTNGGSHIAGWCHITDKQIW